MRYLVLIFILVSCTSKEQHIPPTTESESLNTMLTSASYDIIDLDEVKVDTLIITDEMIIFEELYVDEDLALPNPYKVKVFGDFLVFNSFGSSHVVATDRHTGEPLQRIGRSGRGPGEFNSPFELNTAGEFLYIYNSELKMYSLFDTDLNYIRSFSFSPIQGAMFSNHAEMNDQYLLILNHDVSNMHSEAGSTQMLEARLISDPDSIVFRSMPRLIPTGMQPSAYNNVLFSLNDQNRIAAVYPGLPFLFLFDNFEHTLTVKLEAAYMDSIQNPSLSPFPPRGNQGERVSSLYRKIHYLPDNRLLLHTNSGLHLFKVEDNGRVTHKARYHIEGESERVYNLTSIRSIDHNPENPNELYVVGWGEPVYRLILP